jgi:hypothetical protein
MIHNFDVVSSYVLEVYGVYPSKETCADVHTVSVG